MKKLLFLLSIIVCMQFASAQISEVPPLKNNIIKFDFFSPLFGCLGFSYEKANIFAVPVEINAGYIGIKLDDYFTLDRFKGGYISLGPKFYLENNINAGKLGQLDGFFLKPELVANYISYFNDMQEDRIGTDFSIALFFDGGYQWIMYDKLVIELWAGLGFENCWITETKGMDPVKTPIRQAFKFNYFYTGIPLLADCGLSIGILLR